ncbi:MAG: Ig-like domain-containing protein [Chitinispirillaceae bacterium]|nr:Ig-like domain-containing protein [Chitinispirillaceae bacterium]
MTTVSRTLWSLALVLLLGLYCTIRDDNGNPVNPGSDQIDPTSTVTDTSLALSLIVSSDSAYVMPGDTLGITARVFTNDDANSTAPFIGLRIVATCNSGSIIDDTVFTDSNGRARLYFTDTEPGEIEFTVTAGTVEQTLRFEVTEEPVQVQKLLQALPGESIIKADGVSYTTVAVSVLNSFRNPIVGECVQFITSAGTIVGEGSSCKTSGQSTTNENGVARARLISSNINDTAYITAYLVSDQSLSDEIEVVFQGMSIDLSASKTNVKTGDTIIITATVVNASDLPVAKTPIFFTFGDATSSKLSLLSRDSVTNYEGIAVARIRASTNGSDIVTVSAAGTKSTIQLNVSSLVIELELDKTILQTTATDTVSVTATFMNASGSTLSNRTVKMNRSFKTERDADTTDTLTRTTNSSGACTFSFPALTWEGIMRLNITGYDNSQGYASADTSVQFITTRVMTIRPPQPIPADGVTKGAVQVFIKNKSGNPVVGDFINFTTTAGVITARSETDEDGKAVAVLTSDRRNITATVTATLESDHSKTLSTTVVFKGVELTAAANPPSIRSNGIDSTKIKITLMDAARIPIMGERFNISKQQASTILAPLDSVTDNNGEATCVVTGTGSGQDTLQISSAGAIASVVINYSANILVIDTAAGQACIADSSDSTLITAVYLKGGNESAPISNATVDISVTAGTLDTIFARTLTTNSQGKISFYMRNPHFAVTATIFGLARSSSELTTGIFNLYFKANVVKTIDISGTPEVIATDGGRAKIDAYAFDNLGNRVKDAKISFNIVNGPSGGEYLDPPVAITGDDGKATTYLVSGKTPSTHRQVWITAGSFSTVKSDTVKFTIAGPPKYINIGYNILKGTNKNDGTFGLPCAAIVTDVNGNPVADGTEVTFSLKISGYVTYRKTSQWNRDVDESWAFCYYEIDSVPHVLPFEDFNDNYRLDPGEDRNRDGIANRGEDINGDGIFNPGPAFEDINGDGIRQCDFNTPVEFLNLCGTELLFSDFNKNGKFDPVEPLLNSTYQEIYTYLRADSVFFIGPQNAADSALLDSLKRMDQEYINQSIAAGEFDIDETNNGVPDPHTAVSIIRTVQTVGGKATNSILYGQSDATHIEVMIWAESQGVVTETPAQLVLPIVVD